MPLRRNNKILLYIFIFLLLGTLNNKNINYFKFSKINQIKISGLNEQENQEILKSFEKYKIYNLFFLKKIDFEKFINKHNYIEEFFVFKRYPSSLDIKIKKTKFLAYIKRDNEYFYIGSNGKLIKTKNNKNKLPFIYGDLNIEEFFKLKRNINETKFKFDEVKNLFYFPSGRWDIETYSGTILKLPKLKLKESLKLYNDLLDNDEFINIKIIDLRQSNQVIVNG